MAREKRFVELDPGRSVMMPDGEERESYPFWGRDGAVAWADWMGKLIEAEVSVEHDEELTGQFGEWSVLVVTRCPSNRGGGGHGA